MLNSFITKVKANQKNVFYGIKIAITLATLGYLYFTFKSKEELYAMIYEDISQAMGHYYSWQLWLCLALMPLNWSLEAFKWKYLASKIEKISFVNALKGTLAGLGLGFITPNAIGDYAARIYFLTIKNKMEAVGAILLARTSMFFVAIFYGIIGFYILSYFNALKPSRFADERVVWLIAIATFTLFILVMYLKSYANLFEKLKMQTWLKTIWNSLKVLAEYNFNELTVCISISVVRYLVFTSQYLLLLHFFGVAIDNILVVSAVWMVYFVKSIFPTFNFLNDLGVREVSAVYFFSELGISNSIAILASLCLWVVNILLPTLIGTAILILSKYKKVDE
ncbi:MAG: YbhN family protein [Cytophagales bacterium]